MFVWREKENCRKIFLGPKVKSVTPLFFKHRRCSRNFSEDSVELEKSWLTISHVSYDSRIANQLEPPRRARSIHFDCENAVMMTWNLLTRRQDEGFDVSTGISKVSCNEMCVCVCVGLSVCLSVRLSVGLSPRFLSGCADVLFWDAELERFFDLPRLYTYTVLLCCIAVQ